MRRRRQIVGLVVLAGMFAGCGGNDASPGANVSPGANAPSPGALDAIPALGGASLTQLRYGAVPTRNDAVTYQPDVVIVEGGPDAVRSVSANGLTWTIKADAGHAGDLAPGKILFVTGRSAGRVLGVHRDGDDLLVTIGPVELTDVIQKAEIGYDQPLDLASMMYYPAPDLPGASLPGALTGDAADPSGGSSNGTSDGSSNGSTTGSEPAVSSDNGSGSSSDRSTDAPKTEAPTTEGASGGPSAAVRLPPLRLISGHANDAGRTGGVLPLPTFGSAPPQNVSGIDLGLIGGSEGLGLSFNYKKDGVGLSGKAVLHLQSPKLHFHLSIDHGMKSAEMSVDGAAGLTMSFNAVADVAEGGNLNADRRVELPIDISIPLGGPVPLAITIRQVFLFRTGFGARQATLSATGDFSFGGTLGVEYSGGSLGLKGPTGFSGTRNFAASIDGASLGVNALILADQIRVIVGIGAFGFAAGPSFSLIARAGITKGSLAAAVPCQSAVFKLEMGAGLGYSIPEPVRKIINFFLEALNLEAINGTGGLEHYETIVNQSEPKSGPCATGG